MKIKDVVNAIWFDGWVMIGNDDEYGGEYNTVWSGYAGDIPEKYLETEFDCLVPMLDCGTPTIGIQLK